MLRPAGGEKGLARLVSTQLILRGDFDVWRRDELRASLDAVDVSGDVTIDMTGVTMLDAGSAAQLIALKHRMRARNPRARLILHNAPRIVKCVLDLCGAADLFVFTGNR